ncbi:efflux RND transporter periplasmic adaptor subunit [Marinobacter sp. JSM 1782161]|uniref:efflux RND transporter periplasmic adaptor subunit n=1 Tax=Marinobacter sp. JSM 1782161 TaxID=2685906 RepID=UPI002B1BCF6C|nr:efflux RND transporter periplasmic adaptor subunit [Marinobacter sp. JSM 1782161]
MWLVAVLSGCSESVSAPAAMNTSVSVRTAPVQLGGERSEPLRFAGIVQARQRATLTFQVSGTLRERPVELGEQVAEGQTLARLYNPGLEPARDSARARLQELRTQLDQAGREWRRSQSLFERGVVSEQALEQLAARRDALQASVSTARASLAEAERMVAESTLKAPFSGRIEALLVESGEFVSAGQPVARLSSPSGQEVEVRVPAYLLGQVRLGDAVKVWSVQAREQAPVTGTVVEIAQPSGLRGELHAVLVNLPEHTLDAGVPVEVGIAASDRTTLSVPLLSVMRSPSGTSVFRVAADGDRPTAERVDVAVRRIVGEQALLEEGGLQRGDRVVYAGMTRVTPGDALEVLP